VSFGIIEGNDMTERMVYRMFLRSEFCVGLICTLKSKKPKKNIF